MCCSDSFRPPTGLKNEPGRRSGGPVGLTEAAAVEPGGGQSQARQGVCLDGYSVGEGHCEEGEIMVDIDLYFNPSTI